MTDRAYRTHPVRIALIAAPFALCTALIVAIIAANLDALAVTVISIFLHLLALMITAFAGIGGMISRRWFQSPRDVKKMPGIYPRELAARIALASIMLGVIAILISLESIQSMDEDVAVFGREFLGELNAVLRLVVLLAIWVFFSSVAISTMTANRALRAEPGKGWFDLFLPRSIITERFEYYQTWLNRPDRSRAEAPPRNPDSPA